jgi:hypothetical protein
MTLIFFIAKRLGFSSIVRMTKHVILAIAAVSVAVALNSCCCLF